MPSGADNSAPAGEAAPVPKDQSTEPTVDLASLPSIDSITARTDIRAFLAPGVPRELAAAALRRAWTADPAIRDFVGLADYAWDYHAAGSMPGFGPLEMTADLRDMVARIIGGSSGGIQDRISPEQPEDSRLQDLHEPAGSDAVQKPCGEVLAKSEAPPRCDISSPPEIVIAAPRNKIEEPDGIKPMLRRGNGGALPK